MRIDGTWRVCDDRIVRPVLRADARGADGAWCSFFFLLDCGADRTAFDADTLQALALPVTPAKDQLAGVGGAAQTVTLTTSIRLTREDGQPVLFNGEFAAFTEPEAIDMSVLGRDITNLFTVIVDRPQDVVCLLGGNHGYAIVNK